MVLVSDLEALTGPALLTPGTVPGPEAQDWLVDMVADDLVVDEGGWTCGKDGQSVPVGVGQPTLRIDGLTVGGTA